jgi:hypothetical protein
MNNLDLLNADALDESVVNAVGSMTANYEYSSCCGADGYSNLINESLLDGLTENTSLLNANGYSNGEGDEVPVPTPTPQKGSSVTPEMVQAGLGVTTAVISGVQQKRATQAGQDKIAMRNLCGRKPILGKKKKAEYQKCVSDFMKSKQVSQTPVMPPEYYQQQQRMMNPTPEGDDKIMGMPKGVAIALGVVVLAVGGFFAYKMIKKAQG